MPLVEGQVCTQTWHGLLLIGAPIWFARSPQCPMGLAGRLGPQRSHHGGEWAQSQARHPPLDTGWAQNPASCFASLSSPHRGPHQGLLKCNGCGLLGWRAGSATSWQIWCTVPWTEDKSGSRSCAVSRLQHGFTFGVAEISGSLDGGGGVWGLGPLTLSSTLAARQQTQVIAGLSHSWAQSHATCCPSSARQLELASPGLYSPGYLTGSPGHLEAWYFSPGALAKAGRYALRPGLVPPKVGKSYPPRRRSHQVRGHTCHHPGTLPGTHQVTLLSPHSYP